MKQPRDPNRQQILRSSNQFANNPRLAQITSLDYINAHEDALLLVACDDGTLRLFKDFDEDGDELLLFLRKVILNTILSPFSKFIYYPFLRIQT